MAEISKAGIIPTFVTKVRNLHGRVLFSLGSVLTAPRTGSNALEKRFALDDLLVQMLLVGLETFWNLGQGIILDWKVLRPTL